MTDKKKRNKSKRCKYLGCTSATPSEQADYCRAHCLAVKRENRKRIDRENQIYIRSSRKPEPVVKPEPKPTTAPAGKVKFYPLDWRRG